MEIKEVANYLRLSEDTIYKWLKKGRFKARKGIVNKQTWRQYKVWLIEKEDIVKFLNGDNSVFSKDL